MTKKILKLRNMVVITICLAGISVSFMFKGCPPPPPPSPPCNDIEFTDAKGNKLKIPCGALSCATFVVEFVHGNPWTDSLAWQNPNKILGAPVGNVRGEIITLGHGGVIVVGFDVYITDGPGNDIYVFEVGPDAEATKVEVSNDLINWIDVGIAAGATSGVDINGKVPPGGKYRYVRLTDLKTTRPGPWTGADLDAVAVMYPEKIDDNVCSSLSIQGNDTIIGGGLLLYVRDIDIPGDGTNNQVPVRLDCKNNHAIFHTVAGHSCIAYLELFLDGVDNTGLGGSFLSINFKATGTDDVAFYVNSRNVGLFVNGADNARESNIIWRTDYNDPASRKEWRERNYLLYGGDGRVARFLVNKNPKCH